MTLLEYIKQTRVLICVGSGGVGKTTISAALGIYGAQHGLKVLVMTIDPAQRLKSALGLVDHNYDKVRVPAQDYKGEIFASLLNAEQIFRDFIFASAANREQAEHLMKNRLYQQLSTTLSGSQEFTALFQLSRMIETNEFDLVILDTPPAQHAVEFLEAPEKINSLFQETIVRWFIGEWERANFIKRIISRGTQTVLSALELITGSQFMAELNDFFKSVGTVQEKIKEYTSRVNQVLTQSQTQFFLISGFDEVKLLEAENLKNYLGHEGYHLGGAVINRAFPQFDFEGGQIEPELKAIHAEWVNYHVQRERRYQKFAQNWVGKLPIVRVPDLNDDIVGLKGLEGVAHEVEKSFNDIVPGGMQSR